MRAWPGETLARVPYWVYQDVDNYQHELRRIFEGPVWNYVCLESDVAKPGDFRTTFLGEMPIVVARGADGAINAFENRCAHRGALIALDDAGCARHFQCIYHAWTYSLTGDLVGIAFEKGSNGRGGMPADFCKSDFAPRKLRTTTLHGLVFATLSPDTPPIEDYVGEQVLGRIRRVVGKKPLCVLGRFVQVLPNNWKLYCENVKDTYHASLLHAFFGTFRITRLTQGGGVMVSPDGGHHTSTTTDRVDDTANTAYRDQGIRSEHEGYRLADPSLLDGIDEFEDGIKLQILTVFPNFVLQQIQNCLAVRQILPKGPDSMELHWTYFGFADDDAAMQRRRLKQSNLVGPAGYVSMEDGCVGGFVQRGAAAAGDEVSVVNMGGEGAESQETRATEASVRGFWKAYRRHMGF
jgi:anthranilate 1,2-dioxygenase large subunit/terephthalate 1,2-dioxygenase oxygenase component alpha subunit